MRPFNDLEEMQETIIKNWNSKVHPDDTVFHLGNFCDYSIDCKAIVSKLNGKITLIRGQMDLSTYDLLDYGFSCICDGLEFTYKQYSIHLSSSPIDHPMYDRNDHLLINMHNHVFQTPVFDNNKVNVSQNAWDFYPVSIESVFEGYRKKGKQ